ncbi:MAG: hypothetical protein ACTSRA_05275 [Promethearchaeota archaeon]
MDSYRQWTISIIEKNRVVIFRFSYPFISISIIRKDTHIRHNMFSSSNPPDVAHITYMGVTAMSIIPTIVTFRKKLYCGKRKKKKYSDTYHKFQDKDIGRSIAKDIVKQSQKKRKKHRTFWSFRHNVRDRITGMNALEGEHGAPGVVHH